MFALLMLRLFGKRLDPVEGANLILYLSTNDDPDARDAADAITKAWVGDPFPDVDLSDEHREAVKRAVETAPGRFDWARELLA